MMPIWVVLPNAVDEPRFDSDVSQRASEDQRREPEAGYDRAQIILNRTGFFGDSNS